MKRMIVGLAAGLVVVFSGTIVGAAGGGSFGLFTTHHGTDCNLVDNLAGTMSIYVVHSAPDGATASRFAAPIPTCMTGAMWLSDASAFSATGNSQTGVVVQYGSCLSGDAHILTIDVLVQGMSEPCCPYPVLSDPGAASGMIETTDCSDTVVFGLGKLSMVNGDESCPCGVIVPVGKTTWGQLKALYDE